MYRAEGRWREAPARLKHRAKVACEKALCKAFRTVPVEDEAKRREVWAVGYRLRGLE